LLCCMHWLRRLLGIER